MNKFVAIAKTRDNEYPIRRLTDIPENFFDVKSQFLSNIGLDIDNELDVNFNAYMTVFINNEKPITINVAQWFNDYLNIELLPKSVKRNIINKYNRLFQKIRYVFLERFYISL